MVATHQKKEFCGTLLSILTFTGTPPKTIGKANPLWLSIDIFTIDYVDTIKMEVGLTFSVTIQWKDPRLKFSNILHAPNGDKEVQQVLGISFLYVHSTLYNI